jgi:hypothetical protein
VISALGYKINEMQEGQHFGEKVVEGRTIVESFIGIVGRELKVVNEICFMCSVDRYFPIDTPSRRFH